MKHLALGITSGDCYKEKCTRRRMCVDYRRINKLQPEVTKADGGKGCISLIPLPEIDELYAKVKGYKVFSSLDFRSGYYHIDLTESAKTQISICLIIPQQVSIQQSSIRLSTGTSILSKTGK